MKFVLPIIVSFTLFSCGNTKPLIGVVEDANDQIESAIFTSGVESIQLYSRDKMDTVTSSIFYQYYAHPIEPYQDSVNLMIKRYVIGNWDSAGEPIKHSLPITQQTMKDALTYFSLVYSEEIEMYEADEDYFGTIWSMEKSTSISEAKAEFVELSFDGWEYSGGAHGNAWSQNILVDKKTGEQLSLNDFFTDTYQLNVIAEKYFRIGQELDPEEDLREAGYWFENSEFRLSDNFTFGKLTMNFLYNQYEIAPYAAGMIEFSIPLEKIKHLLKRKID